ncbi:hypothetical protein [Salipiger mangrovisoli]|uniref:hypothetical protein n=1 Tax=Salipiger mangrovisoli TaxID=2865933 RepID=UPI001882A6AA|nr:hypothetical protein [Salipiger mangrovisoli]
MGGPLAGTPDLPTAIVDNISKEFAISMKWNNIPAILHFRPTLNPLIFAKTSDFVDPYHGFKVPFPA